MLEQAKNLPLFVTLDANEAVASVAHRMNEVIAIYPITPASAMGEFADAWSAEARTNLWGQVPTVVELQSEGGAAGTVHGSLQAGAITTTFTASQGLLLMIPNLYKIAGELLPFCLHVAARTIATHALSIFGDHSDVMGTRPTGFALLAAGSVQEAQDFAAIAQVATFKARVPFLHFFDGFRTSHEIQKIVFLQDEELRALLDEDYLHAFRRRALTPDRPVVRGTAQNPDTFFQAREAANTFYDLCPGHVQATMDRFAAITGRAYRLFEYVGHPQAERVLVLMGSGGETVEETVLRLVERGEKVGLVKVRLYRPFDVRAFVRELPESTRAIAVLDRTKEPGAAGEPLFLDVMAALEEAREAGWTSLRPRLVSGRYGLSSKEFDPTCVRAVFNNLAAAQPLRRFTVGIVDDLTHLSLALPVEEDFEPADRVRAIFWGLGSDGTVGANKNSIKILGDATGLECQGYFVYDSKKAGAVTVSHLRFGRDRIRSTYLIRNASFVACHQFDFVDRYDVLERAAPGATFLLNSPYGPHDVWQHLPSETQRVILDRGLRFYVVDAYRVARETGLRGRINTIMQTCFFALAKVLPADEAVARIKKAIAKSYDKTGPEIIEQNFRAVDGALEHLYEVDLAGLEVNGRPPAFFIPDNAPELVRRVTATLLAGKGDHLPVSAFPVDGTWPLATSRFEKRNIALEVPIWDPAICIQCNQCAFVCPHAAIRAKVVEPESLEGAPEGFRSTPYKTKDFAGLSYLLQLAPEDCTGCRLCYEVCPVRDKSNPRHKALEMVPQREVRDRERASFDFFLSLPEVERTRVERIDAKGSQFFRPLFEFSGACAGCGETPYLKLLTQLFGDRLMIANATGCSSIYGANLPTTPYATDSHGRGPAWTNSLFEDNAEFGFGFRLAVDALERRALHLVDELAPRLPESLVTAMKGAGRHGEAAIAAQRQHVAELRDLLREWPHDAKVAELLELADYLVQKSVWLVGGDGWAYDIGYGGLDHVLAMGRDVNILVLDTEVYSNTGGQQSKATPLGATAKFAASGRELGKKDLGMEAMSYGGVYVARIAFGANVNQTVKALLEAESFPGPSLVIAYSHCIAHGYDLSHGLEQQKRAVDSWVWPLYRFDPRRVAQGLPPLQLDSAAPKTKVREYMQAETRFTMVEKLDRDRYRRFLSEAQHQAEQRWNVYRQLAGMTLDESAATSATKP